MERASGMYFQGYGNGTPGYVQSRLTVSSSAMAPASRLDMNGRPVDEYQQRSRTQASEINSRKLKAAIEQEEKRIAKEKTIKHPMSLKLAIALLCTELIVFLVVCLGNIGTISNLRASYLEKQNSIGDTQEDNDRIQQEIAEATDEVNICSMAVDLGLHRRQEKDTIVVDAAPAIPEQNPVVTTIASGN